MFKAINLFYLSFGDLPAESCKYAINICIERLWFGVGIIFSLVLS